MWGIKGKSRSSKIHHDEDDDANETIHEQFQHLRRSSDDDAMFDDYHKAEGGIPLALMVKCENAKGVEGDDQNKKLAGGLAAAAAVPIEGVAGKYEPARKRSVTNIEDLDAEEFEGIMDEEEEAAEEGGGKMTDQQQFFQQMEELNTLYYVHSLREKIYFAFEGIPDRFIIDMPWPVIAFILVNVTLAMVLISVVLLCVDSLAFEGKNRDAIFIVESITIAWFVIDYGTRFTCSRHKLKFIVKPLNIIDFVTILPYFLDLLVPGDEDFGAIVILRAVRLVRIMRVFKLSKHSGGLADIIKALRSATAALSLLLFLLTIALLISSTLIFFAEQQGGQIFDYDDRQWYQYDGTVSPFQSVYHGVWWALVTFTTVGYGDAVPVTLWGKLTGVATMMAGVFVVSFPTVILSAAFHEAYGDRVTELTMYSIAKKQLAEMQKMCMRIEAEAERERSIDADLLPTIAVSCAEASTDYQQEKNMKDDEEEKKEEGKADDEVVHVVSAQQQGEGKDEAASGTGEDNSAEEERRKSSGGIAVANVSGQETNVGKSTPNDPLSSIPSASSTSNTVLMGHPKPISKRNSGSNEHNTVEEDSSSFAHIEGEGRNAKKEKEKEEEEEEEEMVLVGKERSPEGMATAPIFSGSSTAASSPDNKKSMRREVSFLEPSALNETTGSRGSVDSCAGCNSTLRSIKFRYFCYLSSQVRRETKEEKRKKDRPQEEQVSAGGKPKPTVPSATLTKEATTTNNNTNQEKERNPTLEGLCVEVQDSLPAPASTGGAASLTSATPTPTAATPPFLATPQYNALFKPPGTCSSSGGEPPNTKSDESTSGPHPEGLEATEAWEEAARALSNSRRRSSMISDHSATAEDLEKGLLAQGEIDAKGKLWYPPLLQFRCIPGTSVIRGRSEYNVYGGDYRIMLSLTLDSEFHRQQQVEIAKEKFDLARIDHSAVKRIWKLKISLSWMTKKLRSLADLSAHKRLGISRSSHNLNEGEKGYTDSSFVSSPNCDANPRTIEILRSCYLLCDTFTNFQGCGALPITIVAPNKEAHDTVAAHMNLAIFKFDIVLRGGVYSVFPLNSVEATTARFARSHAPKENVLHQHAAEHHQQQRQGGVVPVQGSHEVLSPTSERDIFPSPSKSKTQSTNGQTSPGRSSPSSSVRSEQQPASVSFPENPLPLEDGAEADQQQQQQHTGTPPAGSPSFSADGRSGSRRRGSASRQKLVSFKRGEEV